MLVRVKYSALWEVRSDFGSVVVFWGYVSIIAMKHTAKRGGQNGAMIFQTLSRVNLEIGTAFLILCITGNLIIIKYRTCLSNWALLIQL